MRPNSPDHLCLPVGWSGRTWGGFGRTKAGISRTRAFDVRQPVLQQPENQPSNASWWHVTGRHEKLFPKGNDQALHLDQVIGLCTYAR